MTTHNIVAPRNAVRIKTKPMIYTASDALFKVPKIVSTHIADLYEMIEEQENISIETKLDLKKIKQIIDTQSTYKQADYKKIKGYDLDDVIATYFTTANPNRLLSFKSSSRPQELISIYPDGEVNRTNFKYENLIVNIPNKYKLVLRDQKN